MPIPVEPPPITAMSQGSRRAATRWREASRCKEGVLLIRQVLWSEIVDRFHLLVLLPRPCPPQRFIPAGATMRGFIGAHLRIKSALRLPDAGDFGAVFPETSSEAGEIG